MLRVGWDAVTLRLITGHGCLSWVRLAPIAGCALIAACTASGGSAVVGLPPEEFNRAYAAGYDIAAAERCGETIDAGLVRYNLVEDVKRRGMGDGIADKTGRAFDKTRSEFARKLQARPDYCVTEYAVARHSCALSQRRVLCRTLNTSAAIVFWTYQYATAFGTFDCNANHKSNRSSTSCLPAVTP
jgi:hypothetical protein